MNPDKADKLVKALSEASATYTRLPMEDEKGRELWVIAIGVEQVEDLLEAIRENRESEEDFAVVSEAQAIISEAYDEHKEEIEETEETRSERIPREELLTRAEDLSRGTSNYILFTIISGIVATVGLLTDSAAVVVGSMVIAPVIGPAMASSVATVVNDNDLFWDGVRTQVMGIVFAIFSACLFSVLLRFTILPEVDLLLLDQVAERVHPGPLALVVALGAGVAGALSLTSGASAALVGVMIAVALIPPAATLGIGIAYTKPVVAISSGVLLFLNIFSINLAGLGTLWFKGYRPESWFESKQAWSATLNRSLVLAGAVFVLSGALAFGTYHELHNSKIHQTASSYLEQKDVQVLNLRMDYKFHWWYRSPHRISIRAVNPPANLATDLKRHIKNNLNHPLEIRVIKESIEFSDETKNETTS